MNNNWSNNIYIEAKTYNNLEYYGAIKADFEECTFLNITFDTCLFDEVDLKNCTFENCTFIATTFEDTNSIKSTFLNCSFTKNKLGSQCKSKKSNAVDCFIDEQSLRNFPLNIHHFKDTQLLSPKLKKKIYKTFNYSKPKLAVDNPKHCLSCDETQITHQKISDLIQLNVNHFNVCYMSIETFSETAFKYYMPKLLELLLLGYENDWDSFVTGFLRQLVPNKFGDRFENYHKEQINIIIDVLELWHKKHNSLEETWDYNLEMMTDYSMYKEPLALYEKALEFWKNKREVKKK